MSYYSRHIVPRIAHRACSSRRIAREREKIVPSAHGDVVEIGVGSGLNLPFYDRARVRHIVGVNPADGFCNPDELAKNAGDLPFEFLEEGAEALTIDTSSADSVVVTYTLCSIEKIDAALLEIRRILKPDGKLYFVEHGRSDRPGTARWQDRLTPIWRPLSGGCNLNRDPTSLLTEAGFVFEEHETYPMPGVPGLFGYHHRGIARIR